ncbi:lactate utilization protein C [Terrabacter carboxydivorans]|uniref:LUD domain-containing protein n=1 Tax=Terrabacter carboxydivorans TaxID=619730 RepID=A0ABP5Y243_9MICO
MSAREEILARVRAAVADVTSAPAHVDDGAGPSSASPTGPASDTSGCPAPESAADRAKWLALFAENVADYRATVVQAVPGTVGAVVVDALRTVGSRSVVLPTGLESDWQQTLSGAVTVVAEADAATHVELDGIDAVVTSAAVGIATTGTIVLDHTAGQGRRELTLVPDTHVCVVRASQVVPDVPDAVARLRPELGAGPLPLTWISGPSATSDIELQRVEGVHGPRTLVVVLVADEEAPHES